MYILRILILILYCINIALNYFDKVILGPGFRKYPKICHTIYLRTNFILNYDYKMIKIIIKIISIKMIIITILIIYEYFIFFIIMNMKLYMTRITI